jgi:hypothetical protein
MLVVCPVKEKSCDMKEEMISAASSFIGACVGNRNCYERAVGFIVNEYEISVEEANEVVSAAFSEWADAYE